MRLFGVFLAAFLSTGAFAQDAAYQSIDLILSREADYRAWYEGRQGLDEQFDYICPDTMCEGEYDNLRSMGLECVVKTSSLTVTTCAWQFYGSSHEVDPDTGAITFPGKEFVCTFPVETPLAEFLSFMTKAGQRGSGYTGLRETPLPGKSTTLWEVLVECL